MLYDAKSPAETGSETIFENGQKRTSIRLNEMRIPEGISDISRSLGFNPSKTVWDANWVNSKESGSCSPDPNIGIEHQSILPLARGPATAMTLRLHRGYLEYMQEHVGVGQVIQVTSHLPTHGSTYYQYPDHSVTVQAVHAMRINGDLARHFNGKVFCPIINTNEIEEDIVALGGRSLVTPEIAARFNSKVESFVRAESEGYTVAPFTVVRHNDDIERSIHALIDDAKAMGIEKGNLKLWVKFDNMAGGSGVLPFYPARESIDVVKDWVSKIRQECGLNDDDIHPLVIDMDIGRLPNVRKIVGNYNVQGVLGPDNIDVAGVTTQRTKNGTYLGGAIPSLKENAEQIDVAKAEALKVMLACQRDGYRGYMGVDVMVAQRNDGCLAAFIIEGNARLNSSTSLLSTYQWVQDQSGADSVAHNISSNFAPVGGFDGFARTFSDCIYYGAKSDYTGIIPVYFEFNRAGHINGAKLIAVAPDETRMARLEDRYAKIVGGLALKQG